MRVAVILEQLLQDIPGGTGRYSCELAAALAAAAAGEGAGATAGAVDTVHGWVARHDPQTAAQAAVPGVLGPSRMILPRQLANRIWPRTSRLPGTGPQHADVVFAPTPFAPPRADTPLVVTVHDAVAWTAPDTMSERSRTWHRRTITRAVTTADAIVVPTRATRDALAQFLPVKDNVHVTGEGVSPATSRIPDDARSRAEKLQLPQQFLLTVATLEPRKGLDVALRALADERTGDIPLLVVGPPGWGEVDVVREARSYGLADERVRVLGRLDDGDLATAYSRATAVLVPSRDEGFGLPAVEAMAHGVTPLVSSAPALVEVVGDAGIVTPIGDRIALAQAIADILAWSPAQQAEQRRKARDRAAEHTWAKAAERTWAVLRAVANTGRP